MHAPPARPAPSLRLTVFSLGIAQIVGWGTTYFMIAVLAGQIGRELGLSSAATLGGTSLTLAVVALIGARVGRWQDRGDSRLVMSLGTVIIALGLFALSRAQGLGSYYLSWLLIAIGSPMALYSSAMTTVAQVAGKDARRAIGFLGLMGGLTPTLFWPLTAWLSTLLDWRHIVLLFAGLNLAICLPIHLLVVRRGSSAESEARHGSPVEPGIPAAAFRPAFLLFAGMLALNGLVFTGWTMLIFRVLEAIGFLPAVAVLVGSLVGMFQSVGRFIDIVAAARFSVISLALFSSALMPLGFLILLVSDGTAAGGIAFAAFYGISNGLLTIIRGTLTLTIFGSRGYGERLNRISVAQNVAGAAAPFLGGLLLDLYSAPVLLEMMLAMSFAATALMIALGRHCRLNGLR